MFIIEALATGGGSKGGAGGNRKKTGYSRGIKAVGRRPKALRMGIVGVAVVQFVGHTMLRKSATVVLVVALVVCKPSTKNLYNFPYGLLYRFFFVIMKTVIPHTI